MKYPTSQVIMPGHKDHDEQTQMYFEFFLMLKNCLKVRK